MSEASSEKSSETPVNVVQGRIDTGGGAFQVGNGGIASGNQGHIQLGLGNAINAAPTPAPVPDKPRRRVLTWFFSALAVLGSVATLIEFADWLRKP